LPYRLNKVKLDAAIKPIPTIPITVAMPVVLYPRISPSNIKNAAVNDRTSPIINSGKNDFLLLTIGRFNLPRLRNAIKATASNISAIPMIIIGGPSLIINLRRL
jgi:hypothetical protein